MKKNSGKVLFSTFFLFILTTINFISSKEILAIEKSGGNDVDFISRGVKIEFTTNNDEFEINKNRLLKINCEKFTIKSFAKDELRKVFEATNSKYDISIIQWKENGHYISNVEIINKQKEKSFRSFAREICNLGFNSKDNLRYFEEVKGRINNNSYTVKDLNIDLKSLGISENEYLKINNGTCGKITLDNGKKLTYSISDYESGKYLIIGTPMIFSTY